MHPPPSLGSVHEELAKLTAEQLRLKGEHLRLQVPLTLVKSLS